MSSNHVHKLKAGSLLSGRRFPFEHPLLRDLEQVTAVLRQQIKRVGDVWDVFDVGLFEVEAVQGAEQVAGSAQTLDGTFENVLRVGGGVDEQGLGIGEAGFEWVVAIGEKLIKRFQLMDPQMLQMKPPHRDQATGGNCVRVGQPVRIVHIPGTPESVPNTVTINRRQLSARSIQRMRIHDPIG